MQNSSNKNEIDFSNYPAILACWNSKEVQREFAAWQAEQAHLPGKEKQEAPVTDGTQQPTETEQAKEETAETPAAQ